MRDKKGRFIKGDPETKKTAAVGGSREVAKGFSMHPGLPGKLAKAYWKEQKKNNARTTKTL